MRLVGFMKNGKGNVFEPEELFAAVGCIEIVKELDGGIQVVEVKLRADMPEEKKRGRKPKEKGSSLTEPTHNGNPAE